MQIDISVSRARTVMRDNFSGSLSRTKVMAASVIASIEPKLRLSHPINLDKRQVRFARNILDANLPSPVRYLEIGSFEGVSLCFVHALLRGHLSATAIDPFEDYVELGRLVDASLAKKNFLHNVSAVGATVRLLEGTAIRHLPKLIESEETFDLIYIDGSHTGIDVMTDAVLGWRLLAPRGLLIFDDYRWGDLKPAINAFVQCVRDKVTIVDIASQVFLRRS